MNSRSYQVMSIYCTTVGSLWSLLFVGVLSIGLVKSRAASGVLTQNNNNARTGAYFETLLNPGNVSSPQKFGKVFSWTAIDGQIYAQPLYVRGLPWPDGVNRNVIYVATEKDSVYAFDADHLSQTPLWTMNYGNPVPWNLSGNTHRNLYPWIGITSTPVIDLSSSTLYVVTHTVPRSGDRRLCAYALQSGVRTTYFESGFHFCWFGEELYDRGGN